MAVKDTEFAVIKDHVKETREDVKELVRVITKGNGKASLLSRVDAVESKAKWIPEILSYINKSKGVMAAIAFLGVGGIWALIRSFM